MSASKRSSFLRLYPELAKDWHPMSGMTPEDVLRRALRFLEEGVTKLDVKKLKNGHSGHSMRNHPTQIKKLGLSEIQQVICALECSGDDRAEVRQRLAKRFKVEPNTIDWCAAHRTGALRQGQSWPY